MLLGCIPFDPQMRFKENYPITSGPHLLFVKPVNFIFKRFCSWFVFFFPKDFCFLACKNNLSHEKNPPTFHYTGCLIGILIIMVCYNPYITGYYNLLLYNPTNQGPFFHCSPVYCFGQVTAGSVISKEPLLASMGRTLHPSPHKSFKERELHSKNWNPQQWEYSTLNIMNLFLVFPDWCNNKFGRVVWSRIENHIVQCIKHKGNSTY